MSTQAITDRRVTKTRLALKDAMLTLMVARGWDDLSVQDICNHANVGRSTFYIHFAGKADLLTDSLNELKEALQRGHQPGQLAPASLQFIPGLLAHMVAQRQLFKAVIGQRSGQVIERRFREMVLELVEHDFKCLKLPKMQHQILARFTAGGIVELMVWWIHAAEPVSVEALTTRIHSLAAGILTAP